MVYDVVVVGGGPAGLSACLALARARKRVLLCDGGPRRNAAATHVHNFITRDGTPPDELRALGHADLTRYPQVEIVSVQVSAVTGERGDFGVELGGRQVRARRVILCTGMVDAMLPIEGFAEHWGHSIFQCPYCHGWEVQDRAWGYLPTPATAGHLLPFALQARGWSRKVTVFAGGAIDLATADRETLATAGVEVETRSIVRLCGEGGKLHAIEVEGGERVACEALFAHPPQSQVPLVVSLGVRLDSSGYVEIDAGTAQTSIPGIHAAGDLVTMRQGAVLGAAAGIVAAAAINAELTAELALSGQL